MDDYLQTDPEETQEELPKIDNKSYALLHAWLTGQMTDEEYDNHRRQDYID